MPTRKQLFLAVAAAVVIAAGLIVLWPRLLPSEITVGEALIGGPFSMTDQMGKRVTEKDFLGKYSLIFFGYTYCPDVCPTELQVMMAALDKLGSAAQMIQPIFVSIDPGRDTPETVKSYVENFGPRLVGLTGSEDDVKKMAQAYRVYYQKAPGQNGSDYTMDHSTILYLMGPDGKFAKHFTYTTDADALATGLKAAISGS